MEKAKREGNLIAERRYSIFLLVTFIYNIILLIAVAPYWFQPPLTWFTVPFVGIISGFWIPVTIWYWRRYGLSRLFIFLTLICFMSTTVLVGLKQASSPRCETDWTQEIGMNSQLIFSCKWSSSRLSGWEYNCIERYLEIDNSNLPLMIWNSGECLGG